MVYIESRFIASSRGNPLRRLGSAIRDHRNTNLEHSVSQLLLSNPARCMNTTTPFLGDCFAG